MANYKSAKKRIKTNERNRQRNAFIKARVRTAMKKVVSSIESEADDVAERAAYAVSQLDKAQSKGIFHKNTVARYKSSLMKKVNAAAK